MVKRPMNTQIPSRLISLHGGHSGQFCNHAQDSLEEIIKAYIDKGFKAVGITEHMPPPLDHQRYPEEAAQGLSPADLLDRFDRYFKELNRLKQTYADRIQIYRAFETETVAGWQEQAAHLIHTYTPDYVVGSIHHINDIGFDYSPETWNGLARDLGSPEALYLAYLDVQYEMLHTLQPFVVGHFDIIRIHDPHYATRWQVPEIWEKVVRNLTLIRDLSLCLDYNLRPLSRGEALAYPCPEILEQAMKMGIPLIPGDDSHGKAQAGVNVAQAIQTLKKMGFNTEWPAPFCRPFSVGETKR